MVMAGMYLFNKNKDFNTSTISSKQNQQSENKLNETKNETNILLLSDNSSSMMMATIDDTTNDIKFNPISEKISSDLPKDTNKILETLEKKLNINVNKFISVNYKDLTNIISSIDGIKINVSKEDIDLINNLIPKFYAESTDASKGKMELIKTEGKQELNSYQILAYGSVIASNSEKQQELLLTFIDSVKKMDYSQYPELIKTLKSNISTNLTAGDLITLATTDTSK